MRLAVLSALFFFLSTVYASPAYIQMRNHPEADLAILKRLPSYIQESETGVRLLKRVIGSSETGATGSGTIMNGMRLSDIWSHGTETRVHNVRSVQFRGIAGVTIERVDMSSVDPSTNREAVDHINELRHSVRFFGEQYDNNAAYIALRPSRT